MTLLALAVLGRGAVPPDEPVLHADDEALLRGRAAFETARVYGGRPFRLDDHLARLAGSAARIGLPALDVEACRALARDALAAAGADDAVLRLYWTAGREGTEEPNGLALVSTLPPGLEERRARGLRVVALRLGIEADVRAVAPWMLGGVKSTSYAVNMAAEAEARRRGADDAVFLASGDVVLEGPVTNVWWRLGLTLYTPALELGILAGVTRATMVEEAGALGYEVREGVFPLAHLAGAEEAFTSSSVREVMPIVELDGRPGAPGGPPRARRAGLSFPAMRILSIIHGDKARAGAFAEEAVATGHEVEERSFALGNPPDDVERYDGLLVLGGSMNVHELDGHPWIPDEARYIERALERGVPVFGVCLGSQLLGAGAGAEVSRAPQPEIGWFDVETTPDATFDPLFRELPERFTAYQWHSYRCDLPTGATALAQNAVCLQAYRLGEAPAWGTQFHAEVTRDIVESWIAAYDTDPDAVAQGFDQDAERARADAEIARWNDLGRRLMRGFLGVAAKRAGAEPGARASA